MQQRLAAVGEMAAGIAHEIRNPLASMSGSIQILRADLPLNPEQEQLMDIVLRESDRLNTTIKSFLAYARPHGFRSHASICAARSTTPRCCCATAPTSRSHTGSTWTCPTNRSRTKPTRDRSSRSCGTWPPTDCAPCPSGGRLLLCASADDEGVGIAVRDEGIGIAPEHVEGLFQPFHGSFARGSGLGLAIVHRTVTDYKGSIMSTPQGHGTTVSVRLPARAEVTT